MLKEADDRKEMRRKDEKQKIKTTRIWSFLLIRVFSDNAIAVLLTNGNNLFQNLFP